MEKANKNRDEWRGLYSVMDVKSLTKEEKNTFLMAVLVKK